MLQNGKKLKDVYSVHSGNAARRWACVFASSDGAAHFNDVLGTTLGVRSTGGYAPTPHTAFGDVLPLGAAETSPSTVAGRSSADAVAASALPSTFFTGKPRVAGLGHAFLLRNYRADLSRWPTLDPLGYPDGWNGFAYCGDRSMDAVDWLGGLTFGIYDYFNQERRVYSSGELSVNRNTSVNSCLEMIRASVDKGAKTLTVKYMVGAQISYNAIRSSAVAGGTVIDYTEHKLTPTDSTISIPFVYEAVLAHEMGHADYAFSSTAVLLRMRYAALEVAWQSGQYTYEQISELILSIYNEVDRMGWSGSGQSANDATIGWFGGNVEWELVQHNGRLWRWRKEE